MAESLYLLSSAVPPGSRVERASTGYFVRNAAGDLGLAAVDVPRFQYEAALGGSAYLSEPAYTNLFTAPEDFTNAAWVHQQAAPDVSVDPDVAAAPDGNATADRLNFIAASADIGLSQAPAGQPAGATYMTSLYVQQDGAPNDVQIRNPNSGANIVNGVAGATWQRLTRLDTVAGGISGLYVRRNAGLNGSLFLWGAMRCANSAGKVFNYHPGAFAGDSLRVKNIALDGAQGTVGLTFLPKFNAADEIGIAETALMDWARENFKLTWAGDDNPSYLRLYNGGAVIATLQTRHAVNDVLRIKIHYGGAPTRAHLEVNGMLVKATADWTDFEVPPEAYVGRDADGNQCYGLYSVLTSDTLRAVPVARFGSLGDSISAEPYGSGTRSWNVRAGQRLELLSKQILVAGVPNNKLAQMATRVPTDIVDQGVTVCVVFGGINDIVTDRTLGQMQADFNAITTALAAAGIRVVACTILPFKGSASFNAGREAIRVAFNAWLAGAANVDTLIDLATALADPMDPEQLDAANDSGDHVHPSDVGSDLIADTILNVESPASGITNPSYEIPGTAPGYAQGWSMTKTYSVEEIAAFDSTSAAVEDFGSEWRLPNTSGLYENEFSLFAFDDDLHLEFAEFSGLPREDFEFGWDNDIGFIDDLDSVTTEAASFDATPESVEDFEEDWDTNEDSIFVFAPADLAAAAFDVAAPEALEDFESEWRSNENSIFSFGLLGIEFAVFDLMPLEAVEDYEEEWTTTLVL